MMNPLANTEFVFSLGALLVGMGMLNCNSIRATLSDINYVQRNENVENLIAYWIMSFPIVVLVVW